LDSKPGRQLPLAVAGGAEGEPGRCNFAAGLDIPAQARRGSEARQKRRLGERAEAAEGQGFSEKVKLKKISLLTFPFYSPTIQTWL
jgi:hypothetical protein